jgi:hypothetical protein
VGVRAKLFDVLDNALSHTTQDRYFILLADSGMGKTSALLNYYVRHTRRWKQRYNLALIPLGIHDVDKRIASIENKGNTVLLLDALDEDPLARVNYAQRLQLLLSATRDFHRVLISCRTHFFAKDEEIPSSTGSITIKADAEVNVTEHLIQKIYLSPFTHEEAKDYLRLRYPFWQLVNRRRAVRIIEKIPYLAVRPMLLAHIDSIMQARREVAFAFELYELMIEGWLQREAIGIGQKDNLREFSERLAVNLYLNRVTRSSESIPKAELCALAEKWNIKLDDWQLGGRSLLNRDAIGNYKFAHRSIMEYLFVKRFMKGERQCLEVEWTDQMQSFFLEMLEKHISISKNSLFHAPSTELGSMVLGGAEIRFLHDIAAHGLALLGSKFISNPRSNSILTTLMALFTLIVNPEGQMPMRVTLWFVKKDSYRVIPLASHAQKGIDDHHAMSIFNDPANIKMIIESTCSQVATLRSIAGRFVMYMPIVRLGWQNYMLTFESHQIDNINYDHLTSIHDVFEHIPDYL